MTRPYENGEMLSMLRSDASEAPTFSLTLMRWTSLMISIVPREILVGIERAWKNDVFSGPRPVLFAWMMTSRGAIAPALAGAATLFETTISRTDERSSLVNTKPTLPRTWGSSFSSSGILLRWPRMALRIIVFLPMSTMPLPRSDLRICCIWFDPTLSAPTMKILGYSSNRLASLTKYSSLRVSAFAIFESVRGLVPSGFKDTSRFSLNAPCGRYGSKEPHVLCVDT
eukprot:Opistho-1_new@108620